MNTRTLAFCFSLALLMAAGSAQAQVPPQAQAQAQAQGQAQGQASLTPTVSCDLRNQICRNQTLEALSQSMAAVGKACGPRAGCGNPPQVGHPWEKLKLSPAQRVDLARAVVLLYEGTNLTPKDVENVIIKAGKPKF